MPTSILIVTPTDPGFLMIVFIKADPTLLVDVLIGQLEKQGAGNGTGTGTEQEREREWDRSDIE